MNEIRFIVFLVSSSGTCERFLMEKEASRLTIQGNEADIRGVKKWNR